MSVAAASLVVAIALTALACANWLWLRADPTAPSAPPALADWALVALALHALALIVTGTTSPAAYGLTIVLACAAAAVRRAAVARPRARRAPERRRRGASPRRATPGRAGLALVQTARVVTCRPTAGDE